MHTGTHTHTHNLFYVDNLEVQINAIPGSGKQITKESFRRKMTKIRRIGNDS